MHLACYLITKHLMFLFEIKKGTPVRLPSQGSSFCRAPPKLKKIYFKDPKERDQMVFHIWLVFVTQGVNFKQYSINIFCLTNKIAFRIYGIMEYK